MNADADPDHDPDLDTGPRRAAFRSRGRALLERLFGVDARALAAFRIALGAVLLLDLALRARNLVAFYTDYGVLPRAVLAARYPTISRLSIHALSGAAWYQAALFLVAGAVAVALLVGYRTRAATLVSLLLLVSLHARNPIVLNGGDSLLRRLVLWGVFLPLGERWSLDAIRRERDARDLVATVATAGVLVQVVAVYLVNAAFKLRGEAWPAGTAVRYVFDLEQFVVLFGEILGQYPALLTAADWFWLVLLASSPVLVLATGRARALLASLFVAMHLGMLATMKLGVFPLVAVAALVPFFPPFVWDALERRAPDVRDATDRLRPRLRAPAFPPASRVREWGRRAATVAAALLLVFVLVWNAASLGYVQMTPEGGFEAREHSWDMFAPSPPRVDGWYVAVGHLEGGGRVDAFHGGRVDWTPPDVSATYPSARWRKYLVTLWWTSDERLTHRFAGYLCRRWNDGHAADLTGVTVYVVEQPSRLGEPDPTRRVKRVEHACAASGNETARA